MGKKKRLVCGVGDTGGLPTRVNGKIVKSYNVWEHMLTRCYNPKCQSKNPTYKNCVVSEEWKYYPNFLKFFEEFYREGYHLDKDILVTNNKTYSTEYCRFVPERINLLLLQKGNARGDLPIGVTFQKGRKKPYRTSVKIKGKNKSLGYFSTPEEAFLSYKQAKEEYVKEVAEEFYKRGEICEDIYNALMVWEVNIDD